MCCYESEKCLFVSYLIQHKHAKICLEILPIDRNVSIPFYVLLIHKALNPMYTNFNKEHATENINNLYTFQGILRKVTETRTHRDGQIHKQSEVINFFNFVVKC